MSALELNPQGIVGVIKRGTLFFIPTATEADAAALAVSIASLGRNVAVQHGPYSDKNRIASTIQDVQVPPGTYLPFD